MVHCKWCDSQFACHLGTIKLHEEGTRHRGRETKMQEAAQARDKMQQQVQAAQQHADAQRAKTQRDPVLHTLFGVK